jgi:lysophospholipase L1-like esterase
MPRGATPKRRSPKRTASPSKNAARRSINIGVRQANQVLAFRRAQRRKRKAGIARGQPAAGKARDTAGLISAATLRTLGPAGTAGVLVAEGDSWFDYPFNDVLRLLEDEHGFDVESVAHKGDRVEDMAYSGGQLEEFARRLEKLLRAARVPRAILLSGGGNDIAGEEFALLLNHAASQQTGFNERIVRGVIDDRIKSAYLTIVSAISAVCRSYLGRTIPIITHGYDYPVPDGRGFLGGGWFLPGPWLEPGFRQKGYADRAHNSRLLVELIDRFNAMLRSASATAGFHHVRYLDLRGTLSNTSNYKTDWANELHPTARGFRMVAEQFADAIAPLP